MRGTYSGSIHVPLKQTKTTESKWLRYKRAIHCFPLSFKQNLLLPQNIVCCYNNNIIIVAIEQIVATNKGKNCDTPQCVEVEIEG